MTTGLPADAVHGGMGHMWHDYQHSVRRTNGPPEARRVGIFDVNPNFVQAITVMVL